MSDKPHFDISSHVIKQLGEELVTDEVTALAELVKNAYDADATWVNITIDTNSVLEEPDLYFATHDSDDPLIHKNQQGYIIIEDNGFGMGRREIERGWLNFSFSIKRKMVEKKLTTPKGRFPLGEKGLGRLSTQKLGHRLEIFTHRGNLHQLSELLVDDLDENHPLAYLNQYDEKYEHNREHQVAIDWDYFTEETLLSRVDVVVLSHVVSKPRKGTKLVITGLKNHNIWLDEKSRSKIITQLSQIIFPFGDNLPCRVYLTVNGIREDLTTIISEMRNSAVAQFEFNFDESNKIHIRGLIRLSRLGSKYIKFTSADGGADFFSYLTDHKRNKSHALDNVNYVGHDGIFFTFNDSFDLTSLSDLAFINGLFATPGVFEGEIDEFYLRGVDEDEIPNVFSGITDYTNAVKQLAGIRIYRDSFGIKPYGIDGNDWLKLSSSQTSGRSFYGMRPQNVIGYVSISAEKNSNLKEKTDREGFIDNAQSQNFLRLMFIIRDHINDKLFKIRRSFISYAKIKEVDTEQSLPTSEKLSEITDDIKRNAVLTKETFSNFREAYNKFEENVKEINETPLLQSREMRAATPLINDIHNDLKESAIPLSEMLPSLLDRTEYLLNAVNLLDAKVKITEEQRNDFSELAGLGLTAEALSHEIHNVADHLAEQTKFITDYLKRNKLYRGELVTYIEYVNSAISALRRQLTHLAPSLRYVREKKETFSIKQFLFDIADFHQRRFEAYGIVIQFKEPVGNFNVKINLGKLTQIIDNLILNSEYWLRDSIKTGNLSQGIISFEIASPYVTIYDNGRGIDDTIETNLFQPFVTMKPREIGRGLGLYIVQELLDSSGGRIFLLPERNNQKHRYKFQLDLTGIIHE